MHLNVENLGLISHLVRNQGFVIHHGLGDKVVLNKWIASRKDLITSYSNFYISAGAILIHNEKVLLVQ